jgi:CspA family cold shock protein
MEHGRTTGTVQWFSRVKGYGFIRPDGEEEDVFVHYSVIRGEGYRNLYEGQRVELTIEDSPKGPQAADVIGLEEATETEPSTPDLGMEDEVEVEEEEAATDDWGSEAEVDDEADDWEAEDDDEDWDDEDEEFDDWDDDDEDWDDDWDDEDDDDDDSSVPSYY